MVLKRLHELKIHNGTKKLHDYSTKTKTKKKIHNDTKKTTS